MSTRPRLVDVAPIRLRPAGAVLTRQRLEIAGYGAIAVFFAVLLWWQVRRVNGFYLDEWFYVGGAEHIWRHLPLGVVGGIPLWDRGVQRAYSTLLAPFIGLFGRSSGYTAGHVLNVLLLSAASVPAAALLARRVIAAPALRVLSVGLAVVVPWAMISAHLLTESLAYPVFLWACVAIVRAAEKPAWGRQAVALLAIVALVLCRLDLGIMAATLVFASLGGELLRPRGERPLPAVLRRQAPILALLIIGIAGTVYLLGPGASHLGHYGTIDLSAVKSRLFGGQSRIARDAAKSYTRSLALGTVLLPFTLGLATALAGSVGRFGRSVGVVSLVALGSLIFVVGGVTISTSGGALEERYVFYACAPLALMAGAGIERARALWPWAAVSGALVGWIAATGIAFPALNSGNFFAAPAGAFWTRVMDYRLRTWEHRLLGWTGLKPTGWILIAAGLAALVAVLVLARWRPRVARSLLIAGAAVCLAGQAVILSYSQRQELNGTVDAPGGIATGPRETFVDGALPGGARAAIVPASLSPSAPGAGNAERVEFWNADLDETVALTWNGSPVPAPAGYGVIESVLGPDGVAELSGKLPGFVAEQVDDPRVQFATRIVRRSPDSNYAVFSGLRSRALWTAAGLQTDDAVVANTPVRFTVDRAAGVRVARLTLQAPAGGRRPTAWRITASGHKVAAGHLGNGAKRDVVLRAPSCGRATCAPWSWRLVASGPGVPSSLPTYAPLPPPRPVALWVPAVRLGTG